MRRSFRQKGGQVAEKFVRAAGGVIWRPGEGGSVEVLLVHRSRYDDWSLPKGKRDPGETDEQTAFREVEEETGLRCRLGVELASTSYVDRRGRPKTVRYWAMEPVSGEFQPGEEVDKVRWVPTDEVDSVLSYAVGLPRGRHPRDVVGGSGPGRLSFGTAELRHRRRLS